MNIFLFNRQKDLKVSSKAVKAVVGAVLACEQVEGGEISIYLVSEKKICELHEEFFGDPSPTDCISFPLEKAPLSGEIFVCPKTAIIYAESRGLDPYQELALYVVHGLLHLLGYDDIESKQRRLMRKKEKSCMDSLNSLKLSLRPAQ